MKLPRERNLALDKAPLIMGIINVTPDSFSDGGVNFDAGNAIASALRMEKDGASIVDVGGESTRPGANPVSAEEELVRVVPVIQGIRAQSDIPISIDTMKAAVAEAALAAGADMVNDVTALRFDPDMAGVVRDSGVPVILMHMRGEPRTMQENPHYFDLMGEIKNELARWRDEAAGKGVPRENIFIDPGLGFGKTFEHNLEILARASEFPMIAPLVIGASRKAFVGHLTGRPAGAARLHGSLAAAAAATMGGASIIRVHDVRETVEFLKVFKPILDARP